MSLYYRGALGNISYVNGYVFVSHFARFLIATIYVPIKIFNISILYIEQS